jgi:hypothetical protein
VETVLIGVVLTLLGTDLELSGRGTVVRNSTVTSSRLIPQSSNRSHEVGLQLVATSGRPAAMVAGPAWAWQPGVRDRLVLFAGLGVAEDQLAVRGEAVWQFRLEPSAEHGVGVYLGGGLAFQAAETSHGFIVATAGFETSPAGASSWLVEVGVGGGVRLLLGRRW